MPLAPLPEGVVHVATCVKGSADGQSSSAWRVFVTNPSLRARNGERELLVCCCCCLMGLWWYKSMHRFILRIRNTSVIKSVNTKNVPIPTSKIGCDVKHKRNQVLTMMKSNSKSMLPPSCRQ